MPSLRAQMRIEIGTLQRRLGTTTVYVTHDQVEAMTLGDRIVVLADRRIQQIGRPIDLYLAPVNRFVAGFIGSPPMNFVDGSLVQENGGAVFVAEGARVMLHPNAAAGVTPSRQATLGIRPEDLRIVATESQAADAASDALRGVVVLVERLGGSNHVHFDVGSRRLMASIANDVLPAVGDAITVRMAPERTHLFDRDGHAIR